MSNELSPRDDNSGEKRSHGISPIDLDLAEGLGSEAGNTMFFKIQSVTKARVESFESGIISTEEIKEEILSLREELLANTSKEAQKNILTYAAPGLSGEHLPIIAEAAFRSATFYFDTYLLTEICTSLEKKPLVPNFKNLKGALSKFKEYLEKTKSGKDKYAWQDVSNGMQNRVNKILNT